MATKLKIFVSAFMVMIITASTCRKNCMQVNYSFSIAAKAYPDLDSIYIGDTIWIDLDEPSTLMDQVSNTMVNFSAAQNLGTAIGFVELLGNSQYRQAANDFTINLKSGIMSGSTNPNLFKEFLFKESNNRYLFRLGIIPNKQGVYRITLSDAADVYRKNDPCSKAFFRINFKETSQHMYFNEWNFGIVVPLPNNVYCFKVK